MAEGKDVLARSASGEVLLWIDPETWPRQDACVMEKKAMIELLCTDLRRWNQWREDNPTIGPNLSRVNLSGFNLTGADLGQCNLTGANLSEANLTQANFSKASLTRANLRSAIVESANFRKAALDEANLLRSEFTRSDFSGAVLFNADFAFSALRGADFSQVEASHANFHSTDLDEANFEAAVLTSANFTDAVLPSTSFGAAYLCRVMFADSLFADTRFNHATLDQTYFINTNLSEAKGLDTLQHDAPSFVDVASIYRSEGRISEAFLRDTGVPEELIQIIPSLIAAREGIQFYSCFISYSHRDEAFAERLFSRLRDAKLRVWYAPEEMKGGQKLHEQIETAIRVHDKLLLVLSEASLQSEWVKTEIRNARRQEKKTGKRKLFPVRLVDFEMIREWSEFDADSGKDLGVELREYFIPDFSEWKDHDKFEVAFTRLLRDLKAETTTASAP